MGVAMSGQDTQWTARRKAALVVEILHGTVSAADAACRHGLAPAQLEAWVAAGRQGLEAALDTTAGDLPAATPFGDLRDLISRPALSGDTVTVAPDEPLNVAWQRMRAHDVSQLPVLEGARIVGMLDESDVLLHVYGDETRFTDPVAAAMVARLDKVDRRASVEALLPVFDRGHVAIVMDGEQFLGLVTRIDLLNYLRQRVQ